jgi:hypothetical protein
LSELARELIETSCNVVDRVAAQHEAERRVTSVERGEYGVCGFGGITWLQAIASADVLPGGSDCVDVLGHRYRLIRGAGAKQAGPKCSGLNDQRSYPKGRDLVMQRLGKPFERELRGAVGAEAWRGDLTADAGHLDYRAVALGPHVRKDQARQRSGSEEVQLKERSQLVVGGLLDCADLSPTGVVDEDVDPAKAVNGLCDRSFSLAGIGHIERDRVRAVVGSEVSEPTLVSCRRHDVVAAIESSTSQSASKAT